MQRLLETISLHYGLPPLAVHEQVTRGVLSQNHILSDGNKKYFLKKWRFTDLGRVQEIGRVENYFASHGIPAILPLSTGMGRQAIEYQEGLYSLYPYVQGRHTEGNDLDGEALDSMARLLAEIHLASQADPFPIQETFSWWNPEKILVKIEAIEKVIAGIAYKSPFDMRAEEYLSRKRRLIERNTVRPEDLGLPSDTLLHGDYHESNVFFDGSAVSHVFDFEKAEMAPRVFELLRCVQLTFINGEYTKRNLSRAARFVSAYSRVYPISPDEIRRGATLLFVKGIHGCWIEEEHYLKGNTRPDVFLERGLKTLRYESEHLEEIADLLARG